MRACVGNRGVRALLQYQGSTRYMDVRLLALRRPGCCLEFKVGSDMQSYTTGCTLYKLAHRANSKKTRCA